MKLGHFFSILLPCLILSFHTLAFEAMAATITSAQTGNWSATTTWVGGVVPAGSDDVIIADGHTVTIDVTASCASLTVNSGSSTSGITISGSNSLTISGNATVGNPTSNTTKSIAVGSGTLTISGNLTLTGGSVGTQRAELSIGSGTATISGNINVNNNRARVTFTGSGILNIGGDFSSGGTFTRSSETVVYNGTFDQSVGNYNYTNLTINKSSGTTTLSGSITSYGNLIVSAGTLDLSTFTANRASAGGTISVSNGATLKIGGTNSFPSNYSTHTLGSTSTLEYSGTNQTVSNESYGHLTLSGSGTKTMPVSAMTIAGNFSTSGTCSATAGADLTINGNSTIGSGTTFDGASFTHRIRGNWSSSGTFTASTSTLIFDGSSPQTKNGSTSYKLTVDNSAGLTLLAPETVNSFLTLTSGALNNSTNNITLASGTTISRATGSLAAAPIFGTTINVTYTGSTAVTTGYELPTSSTTLNNLTISNSGGVTLNSAITVNGILRLTTGTFNNSTNNITIVNGGLIERTTGSLTAAPVFSTSADVSYAGSTAVTTGYEIPTSSSALNNLNNTNSGGITLGSNVTVNGTLTLSGKITLSTYALTIVSGGSISGGSSSNYVVTNSTGTLTRNSVGASNVIFPVGTSSIYNPITINNAGTADNFSVRVQSTFDNAPNDANKVVNRQWTITEATPSGSNATITFQWNTADEAAGFVRTDPIYIGRYNGAQWMQTPATFTDLGGGAYTASASGFDSFSPFGIGNNEALPIQLASFSANVVRDNDVEVMWKTVSETNNYGFEIYRKRGESGEWKKIGFVEGHGTTLAPQSYSYIDRLVPFGKYYYRLKQLDLDGKMQTYPEMEINVGVGPDKFLLAQNYPNPFNPGTAIEFAVPQNGYASLKVYNTLGQEVATLFDGNADAGIVYTVPFNASILPSGVYFYTLRSQVKIETKRMILIK